MSSFKTDWVCRDSGVVRLYAPSYDHRGHYVGTTERFVKIEGDLIKHDYTIELDALKRQIKEQQS